MRWPRVRFTIGGLMLAVLVAGVGLKGRQMVISRLTPSVAEIRSEASYRHAALVRKVAEYAVKEYEQGIARVSASGGGRTPTDLIPSPGGWRTGPGAGRDGQLSLLKGDVKRGQADEAARLSVYRAERAKRMALFRF